MNARAYEHAALSAHYREIEASDAEWEAYEAFADAQTPQQRLDAHDDWMDACGTATGTVQSQLGAVGGLPAIATVAYDPREAFAVWDFERWQKSAEYSKWQSDRAGPNDYPAMGAAA